MGCWEPAENSLVGGGVKARKHDQIRVLAESKLNIIADSISTALTDDKISEEEFRLILSVDKYDQMKAKICRGVRIRAGVWPRTKKKKKKKKKNSS